MDGDDFARVAYLILLGSAVGGWLIVESRGRMGQMARQALAWLLIVVGLAAGYGLWTDFDLRSPQQAVLRQDGQIVVARAPDDHFYLTLDIGGTPVRFMVDTGATNIVLSDHDTDRLGIDRRGLAFLGTAQTANGVIRTARIPLRDIRLEGEPLGDMPAWVGDGPLGISLLGMDFLNRFQKVEMSRDRLVLSR
ncbi:aspartyl protease family protein [Gemmobacter megaterium]|uniref:Aspartyl protease family protein n=1 Tax=Gemmobacter megaterium TaxID=1086013 RepID=A0A1N7JRL4_9RHOB|nr:TIGR02281 family clan AA aspartic protease [Gemmobacter megaterium]GGD98763.1 aspartyl protease [Gemmobacter megaterium]SIS51876.1 aspartyl protease family protein [Gemmobacter megaterium]